MEVERKALYAPAVARNREPILAVLEQVLPSQGLLLELASGTGEHAAFCAPRMPGLTWQPSEVDPALRASIEAHRAAAACDNLEAPLDLDVTAEVWPVERADVLFCANLIHIAPWAVAEGLMAGAGRLLPVGGLLILYGPYKREGRHTAPSNERFDAMLRAEDPSWGVRDLEAVSDLAAAQGLMLERIAEMPANNLTLVFRKEAATDFA